MKLLLLAASALASSAPPAPSTPSAPSAPPALFATPIPTIGANTHTNASIAPIYTPARTGPVGTPFGPGLESTGTFGPDGKVTLVTGWTPLLHPTITVGKDGVPTIRLSSGAGRVGAGVCVVVVVGVGVVVALL